MGSSAAHHSRRCSAAQLAGSQCRLAAATPQLLPLPAPPARAGDRTPLRAPGVPMHLLQHSSVSRDIVCCSCAWACCCTRNCCISGLAACTARVQRQGSSEPPPPPPATATTCRRRPRSKPPCPRRPLTASQRHPHAAQGAGRSTNLLLPRHRFTSSLRLQRGESAVLHVIQKTQFCPCNLTVRAQQRVSWGGRPAGARLAPAACRRAWGCADPTTDCNTTFLAVKARQKAHSPPSPIAAAGKRFLRLLQALPLVQHAPPSSACIAQPPMGLPAV